MKRAFYLFAYCLKLRYKLILSFLLIIVPLIILNSYIYLRFSNELLTQAISFASQMFSQTRASFENLIDRYDVLAFSVSMLNELTNPNDMTDATPNQIVAQRKKLEKSIYSIVVTTENSGVKVIIPKEAGFFNGQNYLSFEDVRDQSWFIKLMDGFYRDMSSFVVCPADSLPENSDAGRFAKKRARVVGFARVIKNPENYRECLGVVRIDLDERFFTRILDQNHLYQSFAAYIETKDGEPVAAGADTDPRAFKDKLPAIGDTSGQWIHIYLNGEKWLFRKEVIGKYDAVLVNVVPESEIFRSINSIQRMSTFLFMAVAFITAAIALLIARSIDRRTKELTARMLMVRQGQLKRIDSDMGRDEIGQLASSYNYMVCEMEKLMADAYRNGQDLKNAELRLLQAQINPHFLYNTLDMISYFAGQNRAEETQRAISALVSFYRIALSKGREVLTLREELRHIRYYLMLINMRYGDSIRYVEDVPESLMRFTIIKATLQPIVENAIVHGIMCKPEKRGTVSVSARFDGHDVLIFVRDDGTGIPPEQLTRLLLAPDRDAEGGDKTGYGIPNVQARLRIFYGEGYGLGYESLPGQGARVSVRIRGLTNEK